MLFYLVFGKPKEAKEATAPVAPISSKCAGELNPLLPLSTVSYAR